MKILCLSLLRLGDILLHAELLSAIRTRHPGCQIDFLINEQFSQARAVVPEVQNWILFPRGQLEEILVLRASPLTKAVKVLDALTRQINNEKYDCVYNLTHNFLSARLMDLIEVSEKRGLRYVEGVRAPSENQWEKYFNDYFSQAGYGRLHYLEVLARSLYLEVPLKKRMTSEKASSQQRTKIYFQVLTADSKKNWPLEKFVELKKLFHQAYPLTSVRILCTPSELQRVQKHFQPDECEILDLVQVKKALQGARLLVTGDTSIQHLAAQVGTPIVSIFIGSADAIKTAPWSENAQVLRANASCYPCQHSRPCHQATQICAQQVTPENVFQAAIRVFESGQNCNLKDDESSVIEEDFESFFWRAYLNSKRDMPIGQSSFRNDFFSLEKAQGEQKALLDIADQTRVLLRSCWSTRDSQNLTELAVKNRLLLLKDLLIQWSEEFQVIKEYFLRLKLVFEDEPQLDQRTLVLLQYAFGVFEQQLEIRQILLLKWSDYHVREQTKSGLNGALESGRATT